MIPHIPPWVYVAAASIRIVVVGVKKVFYLPSKLKALRQKQTDVVRGRVFVLLCENYVPLKMALKLEV